MNEGWSRAIGDLFLIGFEPRAVLVVIVLRIQVGEEVGVLIAWLFRILTTSRLEVGERIVYLVAC